MASAARTSTAARSSGSRTSALVSETPSRPDSWLTMRWNRSGVIPSTRARYARRPGARSRQRATSATPRAAATPGREPSPAGPGRAEPRPPFDLLDHHAGGRGLVRGGDRPLLPPEAVRIADDQPRLSVPDPLDATREDSIERPGRREDCELE